jgi:hypothetical protein
MLTVFLSRCPLCPCTGVHNYVTELAVVLITAHAEVHNVDSSYAWLLIESLTGMPILKNARARSSWHCELAVAVTRTTLGPAENLAVTVGERIKQHSYGPCCYAQVCAQLIQIHMLSHVVPLREKASAARTKPLTVFTG